MSIKIWDLDNWRRSNIVWHLWGSKSQQPYLPLSYGTEPAHSHWWQRNMWRYKYINWYQPPTLTALGYYTYYRINSDILAVAGWHYTQIRGKLNFTILFSFFNFPFGLDLTWRHLMVSPWGSSQNDNEDQQPQSGLGIPSTVVVYWGLYWINYLFSFSFEKCQ